MNIYDVYNLGMNRGFSLVELSIVLVILGLLTGGILAGQSLIRASELRAVNAEYQRYTAAIQTFRDKYFALPGDFTKAVDFWTAQSGVDATCKTTASSTQATCNGDGNGQVNSVAPASDERFRFWQHLANAGLIEGQYTGVYVSYATNEIPRSKLNGAAWFVSFNNRSSATVDYFLGRASNELQFFGYGGTPYNVIKPEEAWNIDTKLDDGAPGTGRVIAWKGNATYPCTSNANNVSDANATYSLTNSANSCWIYFPMAF